MNTTTKQQRIDSYIRLAQEWKLSGLTQSEFALRKGMTYRSFGHRLRIVRNEAPESLNEAALNEVEFAPVPMEYLNANEIIDQSTIADPQPVMVINASSASLQVTNQIEPQLLRTALEVILSC